METEKKDLGGKYLCFRLGREEYGLPIMSVKEIIGMMDFAVVPQTNPYVKGIINLRGKIIPIIDLRLRFGLEEIPYHERTCIIIVEAVHEARRAIMGLVVDSVTEVGNFKSEEIEQIPEVSNEEEARFVTGIAKVGEKIKILLDANAIVTQTDMIAETRREQGA